MEMIELDNAYDIIVVGAGNGGLVAAATAAKLGKKVLLVERHNLPGGAASSFVRGRFEFETSLHELAAYGSKDNPQGIRQIFDWLGLKLDMHEIPGAYRYVITGPDGFDISLPNGRENVINTIEKAVPGSKAAVSKLFDYGEECMKGFDMLQNGDPIEKIGQRYPAFVKYATTPYKAVMDELQIPKKAQQILAAYWCYIGIPSDEFTFPYFGEMLVTYVENGAYAPQKRSHEITSALVKNIEQNGGDVWLNTEVEKIITKDGQAVGIQLHDQQIFGKEIISDVMYHTVFAKMLDRDVIPQKALKLANARQLGTSGFLVYLGLNKSPEELGIKDYSVFISSTGDSREQYNRMGTLDQNDFMIMNCLNIAVPNCSPAGTSILYATQLYRDGSWGQVTPANYNAMKEKIAARIIKQYEDATGIKIHDAVEEVAIAAPETFARYMRTPNGSIYGYYGADWDQPMGRLVNLPQEAQPVPHLFFCGGDSYMMDGYSSAFFTGFTIGKMACAALDKEMTK